MRSLMVQGTSSGAGKTTLVAAFCRIFSDVGYRVAPFKSQNMSCLSYRAPDFEISRAQAIQAVAARCPITADLNPILLKPDGDQSSMVYLNGRPYSRMNAQEYYHTFVNSEGVRAASASLARLQREFDLVVLEGAGSPAEINLQRFDIANMRMACKAKACVLLVSDIDRGGSFASLAGTMALMSPRHRSLVQGYILNKFRGDVGVLKPGFQKIKRITGVPVVGTVPLVRLNLPEEDSLDSNPEEFAWDDAGISQLDAELDRLAGIVKEHVDLARIKRMIL